jgi:hypothetical protein
MDTTDRAPRTSFITEAGTAGWELAEEDRSRTAPVKCRRGSHSSPNIVYW